MASGTSKGAERKQLNDEARPRSTEIFERGKKTLVGGVDSPVRAFRAVGGTPLVIDHALGTQLYDVDGREYLDYVCSWGALILGHAHPDVVAAVTDQAAKGTSYGMTSPLEIELGEMIVAAVPVGGNGSLRQFRHRSGDVRGAPGARLHGARHGHQIRRLLSRTFGWISFGGRLGTGDSGDRGVPRGARSVCAA